MTDTTTPTTTTTTPVLEQVLNTASATNTMIKSLTEDNGKTLNVGDQKLNEVNLKEIIANTRGDNFLMGSATVHGPTPVTVTVPSGKAEDWDIIVMPQSFGMGGAPNPFTGKLGAVNPMSSMNVNVVKKDNKFVITAILTKVQATNVFKDKKWITNYVPLPPQQQVKIVYIASKKNTLTETTEEQFQNITPNHFKKMADAKAMQKNIKTHNELWNLLRNSYP